MKTTLVLLCMTSLSLAADIKCLESKGGVSRLVSVSGAPLAHTTQVMGEGVDLQAQIGSSFARVDAALKSGGSSLAKAVKLNVYVAQNSVTATVEAALAARFSGGHKPAVTEVTQAQYDAVMGENPSRSGKEPLHPVGTRTANAWGLHDMLGNAMEWVQGEKWVGYRGGVWKTPGAKCLPTHREGHGVLHNDPSRNVPYYSPHSLKYVTKLDDTAAKSKANHRYINKNNIYIGAFSDQDGATDTAGNTKFDANAQQAMKFLHTDTPAGVKFEFHLTDDAFAKLTKCDLITSASLGEFPLVKQRMEDREGKPYDLDTDIAGQPRERNAGAVVPGPFAKVLKGKNVFHFTAGSGASEFVSKPSSG